jgi:ArsR family transcriptional regulator
MKRDIAKEHAESCEQCHHHEDIVRQVEANIPCEEDMYDLAELYKVFGDTTRIKILSVLRLQEMCVCDIANLLGMTKSAVSHQLKILRQSDLVTYKKRGKNVIYSLADDHVRDIIEKALEHIKE